MGTIGDAVSRAASCDWASTSQRTRVSASLIFLPGLSPIGGEASDLCCFPKFLLSNEKAQTTNFKSRLHVSGKHILQKSELTESLVYSHSSYPSSTLFSPGKANFRMNLYTPHNLSVQWCYWVSSSSKVTRSFCIY